MQSGQKQSGRLFTEVSEIEVLRSVENVLLRPALMGFLILSLVGLVAVWVTIPLTISALDSASVILDVGVPICFQLYF